MDRDRLNSLTGSLYYSVNQTIFQRLLRAHKVISVHIIEQLFILLPRHSCILMRKILPNPQDLLRLDLNITRLSLRAAHRLMNHDPRMRQRKPLSLFPTAQQKRRHRRRQPHIDRHNIRLDMLHGIINRHSRDDRPPRRVDVQVDGLGVVLRLEVQHDRDDLVRDLVVDFLAQEDDALAVQPVVDVDPVRLLRARHAEQHLRHADGHHRPARARLCRARRDGRAREEAHRARAQEARRVARLLREHRWRGGEGGAAEHFVCTDLVAARIKAVLGCFTWALVTAGGCMRWRLGWIAIVEF